MKTPSRFETPHRIQRDKPYLLSLLEVTSFSEPVKLYIKHYLLYAMRKCRNSKFLYYLLSFFTIVIPAIISVLQSLDNAPKTKIDYIVILLSAFSSLCASALSLFQFHRKWTRNRQYIETSISVINRAIFSKGDNKAEQKMMHSLDRLNTLHQIAWNNERKKDQ